MGERFDIEAVVDVERMVNETAVRDVYIEGAYDALVLVDAELTYNGRVAVICEMIGRGDSTVRAVVDRYVKRKKMLRHARESQLELNSDGEGRGS